MSSSTIEWTDKTWNPVAGCSLASAGCTNCYAMNMARRLEVMGVKKYHGLTQRQGKGIVWNGNIREDGDALALPSHWKTPRRIFVNSMSDLFHDDVSDNFIAAVWQVMRDTPQHIYQISTKRLANIHRVVTEIIGGTLPNVWLGASVENAEAVSRIDILRQIPAAIRFISFEPVGKIDLKGIHWAIVGGESGPQTRPMQPAWVDNNFGQCTSTGTPFFFKQWGIWGADGRKRSKKSNGRTYRDYIWDEFPAQICRKNTPSIPH